MTINRDDDDDDVVVATILNVEEKMMIDASIQSHSEAILSLIEEADAAEVANSNDGTPPPPPPSPPAPSDSAQSARHPSPKKGSPPPPPPPRSCSSSPTTTTSKSTETRIVRQDEDGKEGRSSSDTTNQDEEEDKSHQQTRQIILDNYVLLPNTASKRAGGDDKTNKDPPAVVAANSETIKDTSQSNSPSKISSSSPCKKEHRDGKMREEVVAEMVSPPPRLSRTSAIHPVHLSQPGAHRIQGVHGGNNEAEEEDVNDHNDNVGPELQTTSQVLQQVQPLDASLVVPAMDDDEKNKELNELLQQVVGEEDHEIISVAASVDESSNNNNNNGKSNSERRKNGIIFLIIAVLLAIIGILIIGLMGGLHHHQLEKENEGISTTTTMDPHNSSNSYTSPKSTLQKIREAGVLWCPQKSYPFAKGDIEGYHRSYCKAIAAAILGKNAKVHYQPISTTNHKFSLQVESSLDFSPLLEFPTFENHVSREGVSFSTQANLYGGLGIAGDPHYVHNCVEKGFSHTTSNCSGLKICVGNGTFYQTTLASFLSTRNLVEVQFGMENEAFLNGECNVLGTGPMILSSAKDIQETGYKGDYVVSEQLFYRMPLAFTTRDNDPEFTLFVEAIADALKVAELHNITQATAHRFPLTDLFGEEYQDMFRRAIAASGNYGEIYEQHLMVGSGARGMLNRVNDGSTGLLLPHPFGDITKERESNNPQQQHSQPMGSSMVKILERGVVRCGIRTNDREERAGFASRSILGAGGNNTSFSSHSSSYYGGMDADMCRALAAGLFHGNDQAVEFVEVEDQQDGYVLLADGRVDVVAGATRTLQNRVREPSTGLSFEFSSPYFYGLIHQEDNLCLATTMSDDGRDWSSFVFWTVNALLHAEEKGIKSTDSNEMPEVFVFGSNYKRMFRDAILQVGNYAELYERNLQVLYPRGGRNLLNLAPHQGPQMYAPPGFV